MTKEIHLIDKTFVPYISEDKILSRIKELGRELRLDYGTENILFLSVLNGSFMFTSDLMKEGEVVTVIINAEDGLPLSVEMPASVILEVTHTEPGVKGNTATNATKPATLETGAVVNVPLFINEGDKVKIDTEKGQYLERIK